MTVAERFWPRVDKSGDCWEWQGGRVPQGYGAFWLDGRNRPAHRVAWELTNGPIPSGLFVLHRCDNMPCVRPDHLFLGTQADNMADKTRKGRAATGERNGALTQPETRARGERNGLARLTWDDVRAIRSQAAAGTPRKRIAEQFGVSERHVYTILSGQIWKETSR